MDKLERLENEIAWMLEEVEEPLTMGRLTSWEEEFVESVSGRYLNGQTLTEAQFDKLKEIYDEHC